MDSTTPEILWTDIETPGLSPNEPWSAILEAAFVSTDRFGSIIGTVSVIPHYPSNFLDYMIQNMDDYCRNMHTKSGLLEALRERQTEECWDPEKGSYKAVSTDEWMATVKLLPMVEAMVKVKDGMRRVCKVQPHDHKLYMAGASTHFDREWLRRYWPEVEGGFHYRNLDMSTIRKCAQLLRPDIAAEEPEKRDGHRAFVDIEDAIRYYEWAQDHFFQ